MNGGRLWWLPAIVLSALPFASVSQDFQRFAGKEVTRINVTDVRYWRVIGASEVVIGSGSAYLLVVGGACGDYDLRGANAVKLPSLSRTRHLERGGDLVVDDKRCTVLSIREFDYATYSEGGT